MDVDSLIDETAVGESGKLPSYTLKNYIKETESCLIIALLQDTAF
jgi:hypothetical protein